MNQPTTTTPVAQPRSGFGVTALVLGIIGLVFSWVPVFGLLLGILAVVFGVLGYIRARGGMAIAGAVLGSITVVIGIIVIAALGSAASTVSKDRPGGPVGFLPTNDAINDVVVTKCGGDDQFGLSKVTVRITNPTDRVQSYLVTASINDASGARLAEANGASNAVAPGQTATAELMGTAADGAVNCTVARVVRTSL
jgi:hypothetical protein